MHGQGSIVWYVNPKDVNNEEFCEMVICCDKKRLGKLIVNFDQMMKLIEVLGTNFGVARQRF